MVFLLASWARLAGRAIGYPALPLLGGAGFSIQRLVAGRKKDISIDYDAPARMDGMEPGTTQKKGRGRHEGRLLAVRRGLV